MKTLLVTTLLLLPVMLTHQVTQRPEPPSREFIMLYAQIHKARPKLPHGYSLRLTKAILDTSKRHKIKPSRLAAILAQESGYKVDAVNLLTKDFGIGQINHKTIKAFNFDKKRILTDLEYSVECAGIVLADFKRMYSKREEDYWTRYNSSKDEHRAIYKSLVMRYL